LGIFGDILHPRCRELCHFKTAASFPHKLDCIYYSFVCTLPGFLEENYIYVHIIRTIPFSLFFVVSLGGVRLSPVGTSATVGLLYQSRLIDGDEYGAVGGMRIGRGNRSTRRKPGPVPLCPPQIPHDLTCDRTRPAAVGIQRLTAWAMARPLYRLSDGKRSNCLIINFQSECTYHKRGYIPDKGALRQGTETRRHSCVKFLEA
jgi:hypothetical protein